MRHALIADLQLERELGANHLNISSDSQLVVNQIMGEFQMKEHQLAAYTRYVKVLLQHFKTTNLTHIPCTENSKVDALTRLATSSPDNLSGRPIIEVLKSSIKKIMKEIFLVDKLVTWMDRIITFVTTQTGPSEKVAFRRLALKSARYIVRND